PLLGLAAKFARERHLPLHIHLSETQHEMEEMQRDQGCSPVELLERIGFLGPDVIAAHCVWLSNHDMDLLAEHGVRVVYNPESNMKLASGVAPVPELLARGVSVALGTDGCASNNDLDMFREMDVGAKLQKVHRLDPTALPASQTLRMATIGGAHVLGMDAITGSLEPGKLADIIILELGHPHLQPLYHLNSQLVYSARGADVRDTIVQGKILMRDREIVSFDEAEVMTHIRDIREKVLRDIGRN
ncbi:MAG TPA: amidohydrolase family protein, partial [Fibrobacteraceae bacterium]|nr:amidohydrolase family protein [Fibrobacteraceae bacterium]